MRKFSVVLLFLAGCSGNKGTVFPVQKALREAVYASGYVFSKNEYQVFSQVDGYVVDILVKEGEQVKEGQPIFTIESRQQSARYSIALESYKKAQHDNREDSPMIMEARASVASAQSRFQFDSINFIRYSNLWKNNATTRNEFDRAKLTMENSKNDLSLQRSRLKKLSDQLSLDLKNSYNNFKIAAEESGRYTVRSEMNGRVYKTLKEPGELVRRSEALAIVGSGNQFYLQLSVDELDVKRIKMAQSVIAKIDAYGDKTFEAEVIKVYPIVDARDQSVRVDAEFSSPFPEGFSGLAVEANIIIREKEKAMVIPKSFLLSGDSVILKLDGKKTKKKIVRGIETLDEVEIVEGVSMESRLFLN
jgi:HlyD family secretion protein